jgi:uncharacterized coiled-coil protein SlyX
MRYFHDCLLAAAGLFVVAGSALAATDATNLTVARGKITEVRPGVSQFILHTRKGEYLRFLVDPQSQLQEHDRAVKLVDLKPGMRVRVSYRRQGGINHVVSLTGPLVTLGNVEKAANQAFDTAKNYAFQHKAEYEKKLKGLVHNLDDRIEDLEDQAANASATAKKKLDREIQELRQKRGVLEQRLSRLESATAQTWEDIRTGVNNAITDVQRTIERVRSNQSQPGAPGRP